MIETEANEIIEEMNTASFKEAAETEETKFHEEARRKLLSLCRTRRRTIRGITGERLKSFSNTARSLRGSRSRMR